MKRSILLTLVSAIVFTMIANAQPNRNGKLDDGFTWFETVPTYGLDATQSRVNTGWSLKSAVRLIGDTPDGSIIKLVVEKGGKSVMTNSCKGGSFHNTPGAVGDSFMWTYSCWDKTQFTLETGTFDVKVFTIIGGAEKLQRTYKIDVRKVDRIKGSVQKPEPDFPEYYINRHAETPFAFIFLRPATSYGYSQTLAASESSQSKVEVHFSYSPMVSNGFGIRKATCSVDGKTVTPDNSNITGLTNILTQSHRNYTAMHTDRLAAKYKVGPVYKDQIAFDSLEVNLPIAWGSNSNENLPAMNKLKGNWECRIMEGSEVIRTFRWKVGADGRPVLHPEQANGNINLFYNSYLVDMEIPAGGSSLDNRLVPMSADSGIFYGIPLSTAEGRAMTTKVPKKGNPFPITSDKVK
ncbi:MAG TPA: hypothetical protein PLP07_14730 [Pyrinomonadaceae bacterium]|nr:hypothetical protein [Chloracidobacterium sp.]MBP9936840.1 hypothetical protein [Pyrinomonadaceae bacterium]MBK9439241.1 hypothetical protein [Chloracidobacterium sp.]MBL0239467.1 hypothetical protein [Chloracidobacterium sp.]HQX57176.1 hypothetical protein [Pyrinomonadaceae bacterium]